MAAVDAVAEADFVRLGQLYAKFASITSEDGSRTFSGEPSWSEIDVAQRGRTLAGRPRLVHRRRSALEERVRDRTVGEMVEAAREAGARVEEDDGRVRVLVRAGVTQTLGGSASTTGPSGRRALRGGCRRRRDLDGRLVERARIRPRPRPGRRRVGARLARQRLEIGGAAVVAGSGEGARRLTSWRPPSSSSTTLPTDGSSPSRSWSS